MATPRRLSRRALAGWTTMRLLGITPVVPAAAASYQIKLIESLTERTTAATDALLAALAVSCGFWLLRQRQRAPWKLTLWVAAFGTLAAAASLGAVAHGFQMAASTNRLLWLPLNLALGVTIALFVVGVIYDTWGQRAAQWALPPLLLLAGGFFLFTALRPGSFLAFVLYQLVGMLFALGAYGRLALVRRAPGAGLMAAGVLTTIIAAGIQSSGEWSVQLVWQFDQNGSYHLVQMPGLLLLAAGVRASLPAPEAG